MNRFSDEWYPHIFQVRGVDSTNAITGYVPVFDQSTDSLKFRPPIELQPACYDSNIHVTRYNFDTYCIQNNSCCTCFEINNRATCETCYQYFTGFDANTSMYNTCVVGKSLGAFSINTGSKPSTAYVGYNTLAVNSDTNLSKGCMEICNNTCANITLVVDSCNVPNAYIIADASCNNRSTICLRANDIKLSFGNNANQHANTLTVGEGNYLALGTPGTIGTSGAPSMHTDVCLCNCDISVSGTCVTMCSCFDLIHGIIADTNYAGCHSNLIIDFANTEGKTTSYCCFHLWQVSPNSICYSDYSCDDPKYAPYIGYVKVCYDSDKKICHIDTAGIYGCVHLRQDMSPSCICHSYGYNDYYFTNICIGSCNIYAQQHLCMCGSYNTINCTACSLVALGAHIVTPVVAEDFYCLGCTACNRTIVRISAGNQQVGSAYCGTRKLVLSANDSTTDKQSIYLSTCKCPNAAIYVCTYTYNNWSKCIKLGNATGGTECVKLDSCNTISTHSRYKSGSHCCVYDYIRCCYTLKAYCCNVIILDGLPTNDPGCKGMLWNSNGTLKISNG